MGRDRGSGCSKGRANDEDDFRFDLGYRVRGCHRGRHHDSADLQHSGGGERTDPQRQGDRLDIRPIGAQCSEQAWPYFEAGCLRDRRAVLGKTKPARIVTADRF
jgi:hypothetical protein